MQLYINLFPLPNAPHPPATGQFLVSELMSGGSIDSLLWDTPASSLTAVWRLTWAADICLGMSFIHAKGFVHRDLKSKKNTKGETNEAKNKRSCIHIKNNSDTQKILYKKHLSPTCCQSMYIHSWYYAISVAPQTQLGHLFGCHMYGTAGQWHALNLGRSVCVAPLLGPNVLWDAASGRAKVSVTFSFMCFHPFLYGCCI